MKHIINTLLAFCTLISTSVFADWVLVPQQSNLAFISIKKGTVGEVHHFKSFSGAVSDSGAVKLTIDLKSVQTGIDIRDERMKQFLFAVPQYPKAKISTDVEEQLLDKLKVGTVKSIPVELIIDLHGVQAKKAAHLKIVKYSATSAFVSTEKPLVINAKDFGMSVGVAKLQQLAGLPSIAEAVPVSFNAVFEKQ